MIPFVLIAMARSGTQWLSSLLNAHPRVVSHGEVANSVLYGADVTDDDIIRRWYRTPPGGQPVVGITLLDIQLNARPFTLPRLLTIRGMRVLVLERRNQLERLRSEAQAQLTGCWDVKTLPAGQLPSVHLTDVRYKLDTAHVFYSQLRREIQDVCWLYYEDLMNDQDREMKRVWKFLGVRSPAHLDQSSAFRQEPRPLAETVANLDEVRATLAGTQYALEGQ